MFRVRACRRLVRMGHRACTCGPVKMTIIVSRSCIASADTSVRMRPQGVATGETAKDLRVGFVEWQGVARRQHGPDRSCPAPPGRSPPGCDLATAARRCARGGPTRGVPAPRAPTYLGVGDHRRIAILCCPGGAIRPETSLGTDVVTTSGQSPGRRLSTSSSGKRKPRASQGWVETRRILYHEVRRKPRASQGWVENRRILYHEVRRKPGECRCGP